MFDNLVSTMYFSNSLLSWIYALGVVVLFVILSRVSLFFTKNILTKVTAKTKSDLDDIFIDLLEEPFAFFLIVAGIFLGYQFLVFDSVVGAHFSNIVMLLLMIDLTWFVLRFIDSFFERILRPITSHSKSKLDDHLFPWVKKSVKISVAFLAIIIILDNMGVDVFALLAGLGIGGIAFAFAAQKTIADAFGGVSILFSRPFVTGDVIKFSEGKYSGVVEEISLRHTKVRDFDKQLVIVPNSVLASEIVTNITEAPKKKVVWEIGVTYDTSISKLETAKKIITKSIEKCDLCDDDPIVAFKEFGNSALIIFVVFFTKTGAFLDMVKARDIVGIEIKKEFEKAKIEFALPTQTIHLKK